MRIGLIMRFFVSEREGRKHFRYMLVVVRCEVIVSIS